MLGIIVLMMLFTCILLIGENGNKVMLRLLGLIVMVIAVEFFFSGLTPILRGILKIQ